MHALESIPLAHVLTDLTPCECCPTPQVGWVAFVFRPSGRVVECRPDLTINDAVSLSDPTAQYEARTVVA